MLKSAFFVVLTSFAGADLAAAAEGVGAGGRHHANSHGIPVDQASADINKRMVFAQVISDAIAEIGDRYAGHTFTVEPMVARLRMTGTAGIASRTVPTTSGPITLIFAPGAVSSIKDLTAVMASGKLWTLVPDASSMHVDVRTGEIVIDVVGEDAAQAVRSEVPSLSRALGLPIRVEGVMSKERNTLGGPLPAGGIQSRGVRDVGRFERNQQSPIKVSRLQGVTALSWYLL